MKGTAQNLAFGKLKKVLIKEPILKLPNWEKPFYLITNASHKGYGAVLCQEYDGFEHPVAYWSKTAKGGEAHRHSYELEVTALIKALFY